MVNALNKTMDQKISTPIAIVLAGIAIGGGIYLSKVQVPEKNGQAFAPSATPQVADAEKQKIEIRPVDPNYDHIRGAKDAQITLVEYSDTECPFCKRFHGTMQEVMREYDGKVNWVYRSHPIDGLHKLARKEAEATECAAEQGKFWEYIDEVYRLTASNDSLDPAQLPAIAKELQLNNEQFELCLSSGKYAQRVADDIKDAENAGLLPTPETVVLKNGEVVGVIEGARSLEGVKAALDPLLQ